MDIHYDKKQDTLLIHFNHQPVITEINHGQEVIVGVTDQGIGQITILGAKAAGLLPIAVKPKKVLKEKKAAKEQQEAQAKKEPKDTLKEKKKAKKRVKKEACCGSYKKAKRCKTCPDG